MKTLRLLLFGLSSFILWSCSAKTTSKTKESPQTSPILHQNVKLKTGGTISFTTANDRYEAEGHFNEWYFTELNIEKDDLESLQAKLNIDLSSISEKSQGLTSHLKAPDFFNIAKFTTATVEISKVKKVSSNKYQAEMKLDMKGLNQTLISNFELTSKNPLTIKGSAQVDRILFGLGGQSLGVPRMVAVEYNTQIPL